MTEKMSAVVVTGERKAEVISIPKPVPANNEILVQVKATALCTWEQRVFIGEKKVPLPLLGGHETVGIISALGQGVDPQAYPIGQQVAVRVVKQCNSCYYCRRDLPNLCVELNSFHLNGPEVYGMGGLAEYISLDRSAVWQFRNDVPLKDQVLTEPLACVMNSISKADPRPGDDALIIGGGVMGLLHIIAARLRGAFTILSEPNQARREVAKALGCNLTIDPMSTDLHTEIMALTQGRGAQSVFNTTAISAVAEQAVALTGKGGTCVMYSSQHPDQPIQLSPNWIHNTEVRITGAVNPSTQSFDQAVNLIDKGLVRAGSLVRASFPYTEAQQAFEASLDPANFRTIITFA